MVFTADQLIDQSKAEGKAEGEAKGIIQSELRHKTSKDSILTLVQDDLRVPMEKAIEYWNLFAGNPS